MHDLNVARRWSRGPRSEQARCEVNRVGKLVLLATLAALIPKVGTAQEFTQDELLALPRVCLAQKYISGNFLAFPVVPEQERAMWEAKLGEDYVHYHHYCLALVQVRRAATTVDEGARNGYYRGAIADFDYVIRAASREFPLLPEVYLRKGMALQLMGEPASAVAVFLRAVELKLDYTPAYSALIDIHLALGSVDSARSILETGLKHAPNSKILAAQKAKLQQGEGETRH